MADTTFVDKITLTVAAWFQDVNNLVYRGTSAAGGPAFNTVVNTIAALKAIDKTKTTRAFVLGYYAAGDKGGGEYWYDSTDAASADNGGSIIVASDGGRWKLVLTGRVSIRQFGAVGDGVAVDLTAIQNCYAAFPDAYWPNGTYNLGNNTWTPPTTFGIYGESRQTVILTRTGAGPIITTPINCQNSVLENVYFTGTGNTGITVAATAGAFQGYLIKAEIRQCDFAYELAYGINADLIYARILNSTFGFTGTVGGKPAPGASTMVALRSAFYPATANYTNLNYIESCDFNCGAATAGVQLTSGSMWKFVRCDFSNGGMQVDARDIANLEFDHCWFENNTNSAGALVRLDASSSTTRTVFFSCNFSNNTVNRIFQIADALPSYLDIYNSTLGLNGQYVLYDNGTTLRTLPASGSVAFYKNTVAGGNAADKVVTATDFKGGATSPRVVGIIDTTGSGSVVYCNDPSIGISRTSAGLVTLNPSSHPLGTATTKVMVKVTASGSPSECRFSVPTVNSITIALFNSGGTPTDGIAAFEIIGA